MKNINDEIKLEQEVREMLQDPMTVGEVKVMRDQGKSEEYIRHWLMEMAKLQGK